MHYRFPIIHLLLVIIFAAGSAQAQEPGTILTAHPNPGKLLELHLKAKFRKLTKARNVAFEKMNGRAAFAKWQSERREFFLRQIGEFPDRCPLNAEVVGTLDGEGYRIQKILFESRPNHHVTGNLYLPKSTGPYPAVLIPCGHSHTGKAAGQYQRTAILLAQNGMAAFCYDPVGQGERYQVIDPNKENLYFKDIPRNLEVPHPSVQYLCTTEHTLMGVGSILLGENFAQYRIWDGMRSIDYLQSRKDIIGDKIGCTGNSGGGTLTSYLMALDDRIVAASPGCYLTTFQQLIETKGPQDAEQNIFAQISFGMDAADYVMMRAPTPIMICSSTRDATFNIAGAREVFQQANRFYSYLGYPERVSINEANAPHGYYIQHREAVARWMHRWLIGEEKVIWEKPRDQWPEVVTDEFLRSLSKEVWTPEELYCSPNGQVLLIENEQSVFDFNAKKAESLRNKRKALWAGLSDDQKRKTIQQTIGATDIGPLKFETVGEEKRKNYTVKKIILQRESGIPLPALVYVPNGKITGRVLYLHESGVSASEVPHSLATKGKLVLAAELSGIGETAARQDHKTWGYGRFGWDNQEVFIAYLMGDSFVRMRTEDILMWSRFFEDKPHDIITVGDVAIPALHAAALNPKQVTSINLENIIGSWEEIVKQPEHHNQLVNTVHGVLKHYDLPDLINLTKATSEQEHSQ